MSRDQLRLLHTLLGELTINVREDKLQALSHITSRDINSSKDLTQQEFRYVVNHLQAVLSWPEDDRTAEVNIMTRPPADPWSKDERDVA